MSDWANPWAAITTVTALPDAGAEFMIGDEDAPNDVINRTALELEGFLQELAASGLGTNVIPNGSFELWPGDITNIAPLGFSLKGTPTDVSRDTGERDGFGGAFAVKITSNGAGNEGLTITLSNLKASTSYFLSVRAKATAGDTARIWTTGGSTNLDTNTALTSFVTLSGEIITDATPTAVVLNFGSNTATDIVWFDKLMIQEGEVGSIFIPQHISIDSIVQIVSLQDGAVATGTTPIPIDDTLPQNTEGNEFLTLAFTPTDVNNELIIDVLFNGSHNQADHYMVAALFQDAIPDALAVTWSGKNNVANHSNQCVLRHKMIAGTTSPITFKVRVGIATVGTVTFNGNGGSRFFGGAMASSITITEIKQ